MARKNPWLASEMKILMDNYDKCSIKELMLKIPGRSQESINNKIKRLKSAGKIISDKDDVAIKRSYEQRGRDVFFTVDNVKSEA